NNKKVCLNTIVYKAIDCYHRYRKKFNLYIKSFYKGAMHHESDTIIPAKASYKRGCDHKYPAGIRYHYPHSRRGARCLDEAIGNLRRSGGQSSVSNVYDS